MQFTTKVESIEKAEKGFYIQFEDTILFPEGGGQPCDRGLVNDVPISSVIRKGAQAIHFVETVNELPFRVGDEVTQVVDWTRRHDHMQQHSGQHLITAIFEREFKIFTNSWWLGSDSSYIDLETRDLSKEQLERVEKVANELIAAQTPVTVSLHELDDPIMPLVRSNKQVPDDVSGPLRVCNIEGVDRNLCCGTHVSNLAQLQVVKLLSVEKVKNKVLVHFLVGQRVLNRLEKVLEREQQLNLALNGGPETHLDLVKKIQNTAKANLKLVKNLSKELAGYEVEKFQRAEEKRFYILHRHDGLDVDFLNCFVKMAQAPPNTLLFITLGDDSGKGSFLLQGPADAVEKLGPKLCELLDGKGNGKGGRFQGKVNNLKKCKDCDRLVREFFEN